MALLPILTAPDKRLKLKADPVDEVSADIVKLMDDMVETMYAAPGIGLAAPQVNVLKRVIVIDVETYDGGDSHNLLTLANPEIIEQEGEIVWAEGCLSVPNFTEDVIRAERVVVHALNQDGDKVEIAAEGLLAVCMQHEIDHLDGQLFIDHVSRLKRAIILQKLKKRKKSE
ncbi:MAG: peptide deformylase [Magnetococcales bacterium]|nr:peptide deformylase [Magnetococcales bacterium]